MSGRHLRSAEPTTVACPWCANPTALLTRTRKPMSWRLNCVGGCGRSGFVGSEASLHALGVWAEMLSDDGFGAWYAGSLDGLLDVTAGAGVGAYIGTVALLPGYR